LPSAAMWSHAATSFGNSWLPTPRPAQRSQVKHDPVVPQKTTSLGCEANCQAAHGEGIGNRICGPSSHLSPIIDSGREALVSAPQFPVLYFGDPNRDPPIPNGRVCNDLVNALSGIRV